ncbi:MAG: hypothetical protein ABIK09_13445, partial [Pseudomonadota bacterium]
MKTRAWMILCVLVLALAACKGGEQAPPREADKAQPQPQAEARKDGEKKVDPQKAEPQKAPDPSVNEQPEPAAAAAPEKPTELLAMKAEMKEMAADSAVTGTKLDEAEEAMEDMDRDSRPEAEPTALARGEGDGGEGGDAPDDSKDSLKKKGKNGDGDDEPEEPVKTWQRARVVPNMSRLMVGDEEELPLKGMQVHVRVDGFRARVVLDLHYFNDRDSQLEGTFSLRLPDGASPYFLAFGGEVIAADGAPEAPTFQSAEASRAMDP